MDQGIRNDERTIKATLAKYYHRTQLEILRKIEADVRESAAFDGVDLEESLVGQDDAITVSA